MLEGLDCSRLCRSDDHRGVVWARPEVDIAQDITLAGAILRHRVFNALQDGDRQSSHRNSAIHAHSGEIDYPADFGGDVLCHREMGRPQRRQESAHLPRPICIRGHRPDHCSDLLRGAGILATIRGHCLRSCVV